MTEFKVPPRAHSKPPVDPAKLAEFAAGADQTNDGTTEAGKDALNENRFDNLDDKQRIPGFVMRFTAKETAMLTEINDLTPHSRHSFCIAAIRKALESHFDKKPPG